jgi:hypothetical protein
MGENGVNSGGRAAASKRPLAHSFARETLIPNGVGRDVDFH